MTHKCGSVLIIRTHFRNTSTRHKSKHKTHTHIPWAISNIHAKSHPSLPPSLPASLVVLTFEGMGNHDAVPNAKGVGEDRRGVHAIGEEEKEEERGEL